MRCGATELNNKHQLLLKPRAFLLINIMIFVLLISFIFFQVSFSEIVACFGHRGSPKADLSPPENTLLSFMTALLNEQADGIELDVRLTADNKIFIMHDTTFDRTTNGTGLSTDYTWDEYAKYLITDKE